MLNLIRSWSDRKCSAEAAKFARCCSKRLDVPDYFIQLLILIEDKRFPDHRGVDPIGILRAIFHNVRRLGKRQGASTLAQQLYNIRKAKQHKPYPRSFYAKVVQATFGIWITCRIPKEEILSEYLQAVYWGWNFRGLDEAAHGYLGKRRQDLTVEESFFLIERLCSPNRSSSRRVEVILRRAPVVGVLAANNSSIDLLRLFYEQAAATKVSAGNLTRSAIRSANSGIDLGKDEVCMALF